MEKYKSPHGWFIILLVVFTLGVFLLTIVYSIEDDPKSSRTTINPETTIQTQPKITTSTPITAKVVQGGRVLHQKEKTDLTKESFRRYLHSLPESIHLGDQPMKDVYSNQNIQLKLHGYEISKVSVGKSFYLYECMIVPMDDHLLVTLLIELPEIQVEFKDHPEYSQFCPSINPYIHVVELVYRWGYDKETLETFNHMKLSNLKIRMVPWKDNLYNKSYEQVKNSPLYKADVPMPLRIEREDLYDFLKQSTIFDEIPMVFNPPIVIQSLENKQLIEKQ